MVCSRPRTSSNLVTGILVLVKDVNRTRTDFQLHTSGVFPLGRVVTAGTLLSGRGIVTTEAFRNYPRYALMMVLAGEGNYSEPGKPPHPLNPGSVVLVFPGKPHMYRPAQGQTWDEFYVVFEGPVFDVWARMGLLDRTRPLLRVEEPWSTLSQFQIEVGGVRNDPLVQVCRFQSWLASLFHSAGYMANSDEPSFVHRAKSHLASDLDLELDLTQLAEQLDMSYESFRHRFKHETGVAPFAYRYEARMAAGAEMLALTNLKNATIAAQLGFASEHHFSAAFKKRYGVSPRAYRKQQMELQKSLDTDPD